MKKIFLLSIILVQAVFLNAQKDQTLFTKGLGITGVWGGYRHNISTFDDKISQTKSAFFNFEISKNFLVGWDGINADYIKRNYVYELKSSGINLGYSPLAHKSIHPVFNLYGGRGKIHSEEGREAISVLRPSVGIELNALRWLKLGLEGGYVFIADKNIIKHYDDISAAYVGINLKFGWSWGR